MTPNQLPPLPDGVTLEDLLIPLRVALETCHDTDWSLRQFKTHISHALAAIAQQAQEPVAWLYVDTAGERYLCFSRPTGGGAITNLYTTPPAPQPAPVDERHRAVALELDRLMLVIESAVRWQDPTHHAAVLSLLKANRAALQSPAPQTKGQP